MTAIGIGWEIGLPSGWGMYGLNLSVELVRRGIDPALFFVADPLQADRAQAEVLAVAAGAKHRQWRAAFDRGPLALYFPLLQALGDGLEFPKPLRTLTGAPTVGVVFCEHATIPKENLAAVAGLRRHRHRFVLEHRGLAASWPESGALLPARDRPRSALLRRGAEVRNASPAASRSSPAVSSNTAKGRTWWSQPLSDFRPVIPTPCW